jgi:hypothetical protein
MRHMRWMPNPARAQIKTTCATPPINVWVANSPTRAMPNSSTKTNQIIVGLDFRTLAARMRFSRCVAARAVHAASRFTAGLDPNAILAAARTTTLGDLRQIVGEFVFLDDEKMVLILFDQPKVAKSLHKQTDPRPRRAHHLGQFFMGNL